MILNKQALVFISAAMYNYISEIIYDNHGGDE